MSQSAPPDDGSAERFRILFVCTGNRCRSPVAEIMTRHMLIGRLGGREAGRFEVASAGVSAAIGESVHPTTRAELAPWGLDRDVADRFEARQLRASMVRSADLVLGASMEHRGAILEHEPAGLRTTFALLEFAALVELVDEPMLPVGDPVKRAQELVERARFLRGTLRSDPETLHLPDPIGRSQAVHHDAVTTIVDAVHRIVRKIAP
jgi:protein-tyrosine phosphatase